MNIDDIINTIRLEKMNVHRSLSAWFQEDDNILNYRPIDGGWTCAGILEHITLTSHYLLLIIDKAAAKALRRATSTPILQDWDAYELVPPRLKEISSDRSLTWMRPDHMEPTGTVPLNEIAITMKQQFDRCDAHLSELSGGEGILCKVTMSVNGIGKMDVYQYIYFLILHARRHLAQLEENREEYKASMPGSNSL
jgi:hypothetical protein